MHSSKTRITTLLAVLSSAVIIAAVFILKGTKTLDPDFGYRLTTGQTILSTGFPKIDPYTYTMPSFPYVEHAWLIAVSWAALFPIIGKAGLSALAAIFAILSLVVSSKRYKPKINFSDHIPYKLNVGYFANFLFLLSLSILYLFFGVRAQVFGWLIFAIFLNIILVENNWKKWRLLIPIYFLFWANFHGSFAMGLFVLTTVVFINTLKKKADKIDALILLASIFITLLNPYGVGLWREAWSSISDTSLRFRISEWHPGITMLDFPMMIYLAFSLVFIIKQRLKISLVELVLYFAFMLAALSSRRNLPLWMILSLPIVTHAVDNFYTDIRKIKFGRQRFSVMYKVVWTFVLIIVSIQIGHATISTIKLKQDPFYPHEAVEILLQDSPDGNLFSSYGWGGYLIWKIPEAKVFIDGRMPSWRWENGPDTELSDAFTTYIEMTSGKKSESDEHEYLYQEIFEQYNISSVLWHATKTPTVFQNIQQRFLDSVRSIFGSAKDEEKFRFVESLTDSGWEEIHKDETATILTNPGTIPEND